MRSLEIFRFPEKFNEGKDFSKDVCKAFCGCGIDYIKVLVAGYQMLARRRWEICLSRKWSVGDCVSGCHTLEEENYRYDRNSHQFRLTTKAIKDAETLLMEYDWSAVNVSSFEELYDRLAPDLGKITGIGPLAVYDTILRLGWHFAKGRISPVAFVYLHAGAFDGAVALAEIARLVKKDYITLTPEEIIQASGDRPLRVNINCFNSYLQLLDANHLENFLCIFHPLLEAYAAYLKEQKANQDDKKNTKKSNDQ